MNGATCGTWYAGAVVAPDAVVLVNDGVAAAVGDTARDFAPALQALQRAFPASKVVLARSVQEQTCHARPNDVPLLYEALATLEQAGEKNILVQPISTNDQEAPLLVGRTVACWRARGVFRRLTLAQPLTVGATSNPTASPRNSNTIVEQAELAWWGKNPQVRPVR